MLDPREKARLEKERELESDLLNAADLLDSTTLKGASPTSISRRDVIFPHTYMDTQVPLPMQIWTRS